MTEFPQSLEESEEQRLFRNLHVKGQIYLRGLRLPDYLGRAEGRFLQARVQINDRVIEAYCQDFTRERGIEISPGAQTLIKTVLNAVLSDPHPQWTATPEQRVEYVGQYLSNLPKTLTAVVRDEKVEREITSFDLLHWLSKDRELAKICIISKEP